MHNPLFGTRLLPWVSWNSERKRFGLSRYAKYAVSFYLIQFLTEHRVELRYMIIFERDPQPIESSSFRVCGKEMYFPSI